MMDNFILNSSADLIDSTSVILPRSLFFFLHIYHSAEVEEICSSG